MNHLHPIPPPQILTIRAAIDRARSEGFPISEYALRQWVRDGVIPVRRAGNRQLIHYPTLVAYLTHADSHSAESEV